MFCLPSGGLSLIVLFELELVFITQVRGEPVDVFLSRFFQKLRLDASILKQHVSLQLP